MTETTAPPPGTEPDSEETPGAVVLERDIIEGPPPEPGEKRRLGVGFWVATAWLVVISLLAIFANVLPLRDPDKSNVVRGLGRPPYSPSGTFWFGTDRLGHDLFAQTVFGARTSLIIGIVSITFGMLIGGSLGIIAGYFRGWIDKAVSFFLLVLLSFPTIVLAVFITSLINRTVLTIALTIGLLSVAPIGRLARATTLQYADREFAVAARTLGASHLRIIIRELLPNVVIPMGALALLGVSIAIVAEGTLGYLGLSIDTGTSWGTLINVGTNGDTIEKAPWMAGFPILFLFLTVASLNFAGDRVRKYFDVRESAL